MTDAELIERLRAGATWDDDVAAANRIDALTAERDDWKKRHLKIRNERDTQAIAAKNYANFNHEWRKRAEKAEADNKRLREALETCLATMERADFADGLCCCGGDTLHHKSPMDCGHTPVDMGEYHASLAIKKARAALTGKEPT